MPEQGVRVAAGADISEVERAGFRERYGRDAFVSHDYRELLSRTDVDAVFICSPDFLHEQHAVDALAAGKAVYLEKPIAISTEGADRILHEAKRGRGVLFVGHNMRHMPFVLKMRELIQNGAIGEVKTAWCRHFVGNGGDYYFKDWHSDRRNSTGLLLQKGAHDIDILHWLCGAYTSRVTAMGGLTVYDKVLSRRGADEKVSVEADFSNWPARNQTKLSPVIDVEDISMVLMHLENGVFASYQQCHFTPDYWRNYSIIGTEGRIENAGDGARNTVIRLWNRRAGYNPEGDFVFPTPGEEGEHGGADLAIVREFIEYVKTGIRTKTSPVAARYAVATGHAATESLRSGSIPVDLVPLDRDVEAYFATED